MRRPTSRPSLPRLPRLPRASTAYPAPMQRSRRLRSRRWSAGGTGSSSLRQPMTGDEVDVIIAANGFSAPGEPQGRS